MSEQPLKVLGYVDVVLVLVAAPIMLLIGVPADGYGIAGGAWIALRALGVAVERFAAATPDVNHQIGVRMGYMLGRLFALAIVVILVRKSDGQNAGLAALAVIVFAFTVQLVLSAFTRPRSSSGRRSSAAGRTRSR
jgi:phosphotransferase system  glucose/maltose/N-acetylglucosamine-specific IIC component